ncbi:MAG: hypothetical protein AAGE01_20830 [Pseudomonadota bacterium]
MTISDEQLSAYLDGELDDAETALIDDALAADAQLRARLESLALADVALREAVSAIDDVPMPAGVHELLAASASSAEQPSAFARFIDSIFPRPIHAVAWSLLCFAAGGIFLQLLPEDDGGIRLGPVAAASALHTALEEAPSGSARNGVVAHLTFQGTDGRWCREVSIQASGNPARALACRSDGSWSLELAAPLGTGEAGADGYTPASDESAAFGRIVDAMMAADSLSPDEEQRLISDGWRDR